MPEPQEPVLSENALRTLEARYLWKDESGRIVETPRELFQRVARSVAAAEAAYGASPAQVREMAEAFYSVMVRGELLPNSPTLMNAGRGSGMLSACFVLPIDDSVDDIFESVKHTAQFQKSGGGTGFSFDRLRPAGDYIATSGGRTSGPISFWRVFCEATRAIQQGAFRRGANMGMMSIWHPDILKFIAAKNDPAEFENFNVSIKVTSEFMESLRKEPGAPHVVVNPRTGRRYHLPRGLDVQRYSLQDLLPASADRGDVYARRDVWDMIVQGAWATGEPGLCFIDRVNADNPTPHLGPIEATNPCGEQPLLDYEACNLASADVSKFVRGASGADPVGRLDETALRKVLRLGVRFLDDVIDVNNYVVPQIQQRCRGNRKIGLGIMGLADAMFELGIRYDSEEGLAFGRRMAAILTEEAFAASEALARRGGSFPNWPGSRWDTVVHRPMRNAAVTCIAPTGTLSILAGCSGGIEPAFALAFYRHVLEGRKLLEVNRAFRQYARRKGFWSDDLASRLASGQKLPDLPGVDAAARELFVTAHDIAPVWHVRMQAAFQERVDGAISKTINLPRTATPAAVDEVYNLAYDLKCKGVTVYRDGCRQGQPMALEGGEGVCPRCHSAIEEEAACSRCPRCGATVCS
jgi:ribonucleoside-diphosphate reductase alpha chain